jgi:Carboxypeptidase regulatory-like domain
MNRVSIVVLSASLLMSVADAGCCTTQRWIEPPVASQPKGENDALFGSVFNGDGIPIKGIKVAVTMSGQVSSSTTVYTSEEGGFRVLGLHPGKYKLSTNSTGLYLPKNVTVIAGEPTEISLVFEGRAPEIEISIVQQPQVSFKKAPALEVGSDTGCSLEAAKSTVAVEKYDADFLDDIDFSVTSTVSPYYVWPNLFAGPIRYEEPFGWGYTYQLPIRRSNEGSHRMSGLPDFECKK